MIVVTTGEKRPKKDAKTPGHRPQKNNGHWYRDGHQRLMHVPTYSMLSSYAISLYSLFSHFVPLSILICVCFIFSLFLMSFLQNIKSSILLPYHLYLLSMTVLTSCMCSATTWNGNWYRILHLASAASQTHTEKGSRLCRLSALSLLQYFSVPHVFLQEWPDSGGMAPESAGMTGFHRNGTRIRHRGLTGSPKHT